jgi:hypothetical protein
VSCPVQVTILCVFCHCNCQLPHHTVARHRNEESSSSSHQKRQTLFYIPKFTDV